MDPPQNPFKYIPKNKLPVKPKFEHEVRIEVSLAPASLLWEEGGVEPLLSPP